MKYGYIRPVTINDTVTEQAKKIEIYTKNIHEYSIRMDVEPSKTVFKFGKFKSDRLKLEEMGKKIKIAIYIASKYNWR